MPFKKWITEKYEGKDSPFGDLAADIKHDSHFPEHGSFEDIYDHLYATSSWRMRHKVLNAFRKAWVLYAKHRGIRLPSEAEIEQKFCKRLERLGCLALKFNPSGWSGAPDRIVLIPNGTVRFAEFKVLGADPRPLQQYRFVQLHRMRFECYLIDSLKDVDAFAEMIKSELEEYPVKAKDGRGYEELEGLFRL